MLLYGFCEYSFRWDADLSIWIIVSTVVRVAMRMGYHRDGKWFPNLTPFEAVCVSFHLSLFARAACMSPLSYCGH